MARPARLARRLGHKMNIGTKGDVFVLTEEQRHELQRINREWLEAHPPALPAATHASEASNHETNNCRD